MKDITKEIITELLKLDESWDKRTGKLRTAFVVKAYQDIREMRYYDEIWFPHMMRIMRLLRALQIVPKEAFSVETLGYGIEIEGWWITDPDWGSCIENELTYGSNAAQRYLDRMWYEEWQWEEPTEEEILTLGVSAPFPVQMKML